jgi:hypothetical protein
MHKENQDERDHKEDIYVGGRIILKWILEHEMVWSRLMWLTIGTSFRLLGKR